MAFSCLRVQKTKAVQNTVAQKIPHQSDLAPIENQELQLDLFRTVENMVWAFQDQSTVVKYKQELRFEWCAIVGTLYFEL